MLKIVSEERFEILSTINPAKVINDEFISSEYDKIIKPEKREKKGIFNFWRRK